MDDGTGHVGLRAATSHPTATSKRSDNRTDIAKSVVVIAQRVLENVKAGRVYPRDTVEWAEHIVKANVPAPTPTGHARAFASEVRP